MKNSRYRGIDRTRLYKKLFNEVGGCCQICGTIDRLVIDHNHNTDEVRSLLCYRHNTGLGLFQDDPDLLEKAAQYLRRFEEIIPIISDETKTTSIGDINRLVVELLDNPTYESDRARGRQLSKLLGCSEAAACIRVRRVKNVTKHVTPHSKFLGNVECDIKSP